MGGGRGRGPSWNEARRGEATVNPLQSKSNHDSAMPGPQYVAGWAGLAWAGRANPGSPRMRSREPSPPTIRSFLVACSLSFHSPEVVVVRGLGPRTGWPRFDSQ